MFIYLIEEEYQGAYLCAFSTQELAEQHIIANQLFYAFIVRVTLDGAPFQGEEYMTGSDTYMAAREAWLAESY